MPAGIQQTKIGGHGSEYRKQKLEKQQEELVKVIKQTPSQTSTTQITYKFYTPNTFIAITSLTTNLKKSSMPNRLCTGDERHRCYIITGTRASKLPVGWAS